jgi:hypothetical protein
MPSCWRWSVASAADEATLLAGVEGVRVPAVAFEGLFAGSRRWAHSTPASSGSAVVVAVGVSGAEVSYPAMESLVCSAARSALGVGRRFGDDALAYFTERLDPLPTRQALAQVLRRAKRNKAFDRTWRIGLALDGTGAARSGGRLPALSPGAGPTPSSHWP